MNVFLLNQQDYQNLSSSTQPSFSEKGGRDFLIAVIAAGLFVGFASAAISNLQNGIRRRACCYALAAAGCMALSVATVLNAAFKMTYHPPQLEYQ